MTYVPADDRYDPDDLSPAAEARGLKLPRAPLACGKFRAMDFPHQTKAAICRDRLDLACNHFDFAEQLRPHPMATAEEAVRTSCRHDFQGNCGTS